MLKKWFPIIDWMSNYQRGFLKGDISAGVIVAVMLIPQGMAYAMLAGIDPVIGLYAVTVPLLIYAIFASSRQLAVGPVAMVSLLVFTGVSSIVEPGTPEFLNYVILLALMVGVIQLVLGLTKAGFIVNFLSHAVISGFTSAAAIVIALSQIKHLLGVNLQSHDYTHQFILEVFQRVSDIHLLTFFFGITSILILVFLKKYVPVVPGPIFVVAFSILVTYFYRLDEMGLKIVGDIPKGLPSFSIPVANIEAFQVLLPTALMISFIAFMESIAVAKAIAVKEKYKVDPNQELKGLGLANIFSSFIASMPVTGGFSRTAVNYQSGAKTGLASIISAVLIIITLLFLTPLFYYLPNAVLAAIIIVAVYSLIDINEAKHLFKVKKIDGWVLTVTFFLTLFIGIEIGILIGIVVSLVVFIWRSAYPHIAEVGYLKEQNVFRNVKRFPEVTTYQDALILRVDRSLYFANMSFLESKIEECLTTRPVKWLILDMSAVNDMDAVAIDQLEEIMNVCKEMNVTCILTGIKGPVRDLVEKAGWNRRYEKQIDYYSVDHAIKELKLKENVV
ncbi:SulP family inorganic anion transporter [Alkalihalobacterium chitinilyticum]|uniref:Sulfate permease n=1 Tax=Alkalihalobacterium chitinilyticum TaxID=2980103 RepID=A0ABT5VE55_9BACI|nr:sulfate permease [Alkalihalobacterium chitinilyticum]MDE5413416.1 sulfate permease [Alkalihalobacterium chitinilyticum]